MSKTLIVEDDCELLKQVEKYPNEVQVFDTTLEAFAHEEASFRLDNHEGWNEDLTVKQQQSVLEDAECALSNYLLYDVDALNYDGLDNIAVQCITRGCLHRTALYF